MTGMSLRFLYIYCHDLAAMRHFYTDLVGLSESYYAPAPDGGLGYRCDSLQFTILPADEIPTAPPGWHQQPGWQGGTVSLPSWSIESASQEAFAAAVERLTEAGVPVLHSRPRWVGYWSFPVRDPMGNTVELTLPTSGTPTVLLWPESGRT